MATESLWSRYVVAFSSPVTCDKRRPNSLRKVIERWPITPLVSMATSVNVCGCAGSDARNHIRKFGCALLGVIPTTHRLLSWGKRIYAVAAMSSTSLLTVELTHEIINPAIWWGQSHSIAIMDNYSMHHVQEVKQLFKDAGILLFFLLPYSPDMKPIEKTFRFIKTYLRKHAELLQAIPNLIRRCN